MPKKRKKYSTKKEWCVYNETDRVWAHPSLFTRKQAELFIERFPSRFGAQGYYLTSNLDKIKPEEVSLTIRKG